MSFDKSIYPCSQHTNQDIGHFHHPKKFSHAPLESFYPHPTIGNHCSGFYPRTLSVLTLMYWNHIVCTLSYLVLQFFSFMRFVNITECYQYFFPFYCCVVFHCMNISPIDGHLNCFLVWFIKNKVIKVILFFY